MRQVGNTPAATTAASLKESMARMGHVSVRAALIYQHASQRDQAIAAALGEAFKVARASDKGDKSTPKRSGTEAVYDLEKRQGPGRKTGLLPGPSWWERATGIEPA